VEFLVKNVNQKCKVEETFQKLIENTKIELEIIQARKIIIAKTNVSLFEPYKLIFTKGKKKIIILYYDVFIKEKEAYYLYDLSTEVSLEEIRKLIKCF